MSLVQLFKAWVAEQPPETTIDHLSYETCALGEFAKTLPETEDGEIIQGWDVAHSLHQVYGDEPYNTIGNGGSASMYYNREAVPMATYGELSVWLNSLEPVATSV